MLYIPNEKSFPDLLKKEGWNRTQIKNHTWKFHYVFTTAVRLTQLRQTDYVRLNIGDLDKLLKNTIVQDERVRLSKIILDYLVKWGMVIRRHHNNDYETEDEGKLYKTEVFVKVTEETMAAGWSVWQEPAHLSPTPEEAKNPKKNVLTGIYKELDAQLHRVTIDAAAARAFTEKAYLNKLALPAKRREFLLADNTKAYTIETNRYVNEEVRSSWHMWIDGIEAGDFASAQDERGTGRFFNRLSSSPKLLRGTLRLDGEKMYEADIANSQPLIFCTYLHEHFASNMPENVREFIEECEKGTFYATVRKLVLSEKEQAILSKRDFKTLFFAKIFYSTQKRNWVWRQKFAAKYPDVSEYITTMKLGGYKDLPRALTQKESQIMLHGVARKLLDAGVPFMPLHDAIYTSAQWLPLAQQFIREEFALHGVGVTINEPDELPKSAPQDDDDAARVEALHLDMEKLFAQVFNSSDHLLDNYQVLKADDDDEYQFPKPSQEELEDFFA